MTIAKGLMIHGMQIFDTLKQFLLRGTTARQSQIEIIISSFGAIVGIALVVALSPYLVGDAGAPYIVASMGAAAVLLYAAPHSPLTQPWSFVGGHLISATVGVTCAQWVPDVYIASGLAVGLAIFAMHELNCLHPPGGAAALVAVVGGDQIHALGYMYVVVPVGLNVLILGTAVWLTRLILANYQQRRQSPFIFYQEDPNGNSEIENGTAISNNDLTHALQDMHTYIDVSIEDLKLIYAHATLFAHKRKVHGMFCQDMMIHQLIAVEFGDYLDNTWALMQQHHIKSIPVIDRARRVIGIITVNDFQQEAAKQAGSNMEQRLQAVIRRSNTLTTHKSEVVGQLMTSSVITLGEEQPVIKAVSIFNEHVFSHIPIVNKDRRLSGMLARSSVLPVHGS